MSAPNYTPAELRAQVAAERRAAHEIVEQKSFSLIAGITCGMLMAAADQLERLARERDTLRKRETYLEGKFDAALEEIARLSNELERRAKDQTP